MNLEEKDKQQQVVDNTTQNETEQQHNSNSNSSSTLEEQGTAIQELIQEYAVEDEKPHNTNFVLREILGGDVLASKFVRQQVGWFLLIMILSVFYISLRYSCQQKLIEIDNLTHQLQDAKYKALYSTSELTEKSRESNVLEMLKNNNDTTIKIAKEPPYIIEVPNE